MPTFFVDQTHCPTAARGNAIGRYIRTCSHSFLCNSWKKTQTWIAFIFGKICLVAKKLMKMFDCLERKNKTLFYTLAENTRSLQLRGDFRSWIFLGDWFLVSSCGHFWLNLPHIYGGIRHHRTHIVHIRLRFTQTHDGHLNRMSVSAFFFSCVKSF